ncbi:RNA-binding domain-containing protein [Exidia glandulosa HHB12029]|uniref:RNA-binding domain-containing protein n=1 Tax=Exidia glandulosa HHB12029 TaxID=1314781 RepID=A0A166AHV5_EXIGL|nr:RNA-binding domain-containing protein [Exidia glandulosa HHB12029]
MSDTEMNIDDGPGVVKRRGRGFKSADNDGLDTAGGYDRIDAQPKEGDTGKAARSVEGWIVMVTNVHEEATEEDVHDKFSEFGDIKNLHLNLDRRTGYVKGYALVEYETYAEAKRAIDEAPSSTFLEQSLKCDFAFQRAPPTGPRINRPGRGRSASPGRR